MSPYLPSNLYGTVTYEQCKACKELFSDEEQPPRAPAVEARGLSLR